MTLEYSVDLNSCNTLQLSAVAEIFCILNAADLEAAFERVKPLIRERGVRVLGGGSNIVLLQDISEVVLQLHNHVIECVAEDEAHIEFRVGASVQWHDWVQFSVEHGYSGFENLALIPGSVGAAPIQNIGAYGVELSDHLLSVEALHLETGERCELSAEACRLGYRSSLFKEPDQKGKWLILSIKLRCHKSFKPVLEYSDLAQWREAEERSITPESLMNQVMRIRRQKLPDPSVRPNVGSFFKNPVVSKKQLIELQSDYSCLKGRLVSDQTYKLSAAQLIEHCGWKGKRSGSVGVSERHALVIVNYGGCTGEELVDFVHQIQLSIWRDCQVWLEPEPDIWGDTHQIQMLQRPAYSEIY